jgi:hypothetical protein
MNHQFSVTENLCLNNSFGTIHEEDNVKLTVNVNILNETRGSFEYYSACGDWYAEGMLKFDEDKALVDYDGVFCLPEFILGKLEQLGYDVKYMRETLQD